MARPLSPTHSHTGTQVIVELDNRTLAHLVAVLADAQRGGTYARLALEVAPSGKADVKVAPGAGTWTPPLNRAPLTTKVQPLWDEAVTPGSDDE